MESVCIQTSLAWPTIGLRLGLSMLILKLGLYNVQQSFVVLLSEGGTNVEGGYQYGIPKVYILQVEMDS